MSVQNAYITADQISKIFSTLNIDSMGDPEKQDTLDRATGDLEAELCERFIVPLTCDGGGDFSTSPSFARQKVLNAIRASIRKTLGEDKNANLVVDSTERYIDLHEKAFRSHVKDLLDPKKHYGFQMQAQAEGSIDPIQSVGLARADNDTHVVLDRSVID